jgi:hypothetical protein
MTIAGFVLTLVVKELVELAKVAAAETYDVDTNPAVEAAADIGQ